MKWVLIGGAAMLLVILAATWLQNAPAASARKAGAAFMAAAAAGDQAKVQSMLSSDADITAEQVVVDYRGLTGTEAFDVKKAMSNTTGVEYLVLAGGLDSTGVPHGTTFAVRRENGVWRVLRAGPSFAY